MKLWGILRRAMRCMVVGVVVVATVSGCVVEYGTSVPEAARRVLAEGSVVYDLRSGLTREDVGFEPGFETHTIQTRGGESVDVTVILPDGRRFEFPATRISFSASGPLGEVRNPHSLDLARRYPTVDEAYAVLVAFDEEFGLDTTTRPRLEDWRDASARKLEVFNTKGGPLMRDPQVWETPDSDDERSFEVEASLDAHSGGVSLRFILRWPPVPVDPPPGG